MFLLFRYFPLYKLLRREDMLETIEIILLALIVLFAILAIEQGQLIRAVLGLLGVTAGIGVIFFLMGAYHVAILQLLVYAGGIIALFIVVILLTRGVEE